METEEAATDVVKTLRAAGHIAYFAGGWVRDRLLDRPSDDIDIATEAAPEEVERLFSHTIDVGKSFGATIVVHENHTFEVSAFRKDGLYLYGRRPESIEYSTPEQDAKRRDFTINGMFYDPLDGQVLDYVGGKEDLARKVLRAIGNPHERFQEDRLRMIRAVRLIARLGFSLDPETEQAICSQSHTLFPAVAVERIWAELEKMAAGGGAQFGEAMRLMQQLGLFSELFPGLSEEEIATRTAPFAHYPQDTPLILYLLALLPNSDPEKLGRRFHAANKEIRLAKDFLRSQGEKDLVEWAHFYAHPRATLFWEISLAHLAGEERKQEETEHQERLQRLALHIERIREKRPLVSAKTLMERGVPPGPEMGTLLAEAERLAITQDIHEKENLLGKLL